MQPLKPKRTISVPVQKSQYNYQVIHTMLKQSKWSTLYNQMTGSDEKIRSYKGKSKAALTLFPFHVPLDRTDF
jgi:hypothetical protein